MIEVGSIINFLAIKKSTAVDISLILKHCDFIFSTITKCRNHSIETGFTR